MNKNYLWISSTKEVISKLNSMILLGEAKELFIESYKRQETEISFSIGARDTTVFINLLEAVTIKENQDITLVTSFDHDMYDKEFKHIIKNGICELVSIEICFGYSGIPDNLPKELSEKIYNTAVKKFKELFTVNIYEDGGYDVDFLGDKVPEGLRTQYNYEYTVDNFLINASLVQHNIIEFKVMKHTRTMNMFYIN